MTSFMASEVDDVDGFLLPLHSSLSPIDLMSDLGLFAPVTTDQSSAEDNSTSADVGDSLDECSANTYVYEDFTQTEWVRASFIVLYVVIVVLSVVGNFMVIWTIARNRHMRTVTNYYILNLAVADFLVALVVMPLKLIEYTAPCQWHVFSRHSLLCPLLYYILPVFVFTSILTLAAISVERSVAYNTIITINDVNEFRDGRSKPWDKNNLLEFGGGLDRDTDPGKIFFHGRLTNIYSTIVFCRHSLSGVVRPSRLCGGILVLSKSYSNVLFLLTF